MDDQMVEEIARGYAVANLWTAGVDEMQGVYQPDGEKVEALMPYAREAAAAFVHIVGAWAVEAQSVDHQRIGNCLHYDREGHGTGFTDEGDTYQLEKFAKVARAMGPDSQMQDQLLDRFPSEAFAD